MTHWCKKSCKCITATQSCQVISSPAHYGQIKPMTLWKSGSIFFIHVYNPDSKTVGVKHKWNRMWKQCEDIIMNKTMIGYERGILERLSRSWLYERTLIYGLRNTCFYLHFTMSKLFWNHSCTIYASFSFFFFFFLHLLHVRLPRMTFLGEYFFFLINI